MTIFLWEKSHRYHKNVFCSKCKAAMRTFCVFSITIVENPLFSFFFQFLWCQLCRLWNSRSSNTSIFIDVSGRLPCRHNFTFFSNLNAFSNELGSQRKTSCWMLSFKFGMKTLILFSSRVSFTLIFNF